jgi:lysine-specific demethylase 3
MYNAFAARERKGGQGSTRLHMDVADAINVMLYASPLDILPEKGKKVEVKREVVDLTGDGQDGEVAVERKEGGGDGEVAKNKVVQVEVPNGSGLSGEAEKARSEDSSDLLSSQSAALGAQADPQPPRLPEEPVPIVGSESHNQDSAARDGIPGGDNAKSLGFQGSREATPLRRIAEDKVSDSPDTTKSKDPQQPGCAVWDIFRAQDADKIRTYLSRKFGSRHVFVDPIHAQMFFLDASMRRELWEKYGVVSHRIYQYPVCLHSGHRTDDGKGYLS